MSSRLISKAISDLYGGVSQQDPGEMNENQCIRQVNCNIDVVSGLSKRPGTYTVAKIRATNDENRGLAKYSIYNANEGTKSLIEFKDNTVKVFDLITGQERPLTIEGNAGSYLTTDNPKASIKTIQVDNVTLVLNREYRVAAGKSPYTLGSSLSSILSINAPGQRNTGDGSDSDTGQVENYTYWNFGDANIEGSNTNTNMGDDTDLINGGTTPISDNYNYSNDPASAGTNSDNQNTVMPQSNVGKFSYALNRLRAIPARYYTNGYLSLHATHPKPTSIVFNMVGGSTYTAYAADIVGTRDRSWVVSNVPTSPGIQNSMLSINGLVGHPGGAVIGGGINNLALRPVTIVDSNYGTYYHFKYKIKVNGEFVFNDTTNVWKPYSTSGTPQNIDAIAGVGDTVEIVFFDDDETTELSTQTMTHQGGGSFRYTLPSSTSAVANITIGASVNGVSRSITAQNLDSFNISGTVATGDTLTFTYFDGTDYYVVTKKATSTSYTFAYDTYAVIETIAFDSLRDVKGWLTSFGVNLGIVSYVGVENLNTKVSGEPITLVKTLGALRDNVWPISDPFVLYQDGSYISNVISFGPITDIYAFTATGDNVLSGGKAIVCLGSGANPSYNLTDTTNAIISYSGYPNQPFE